MTHEQQLSDNNFMYNNDTTNSGVGMATIWPDDQQKQQQKIQDNNNSSNKPTHPEWGVMKEQDFHPLTLKHQIDLENSHQSGNLISDFYFWQANLGGYCMADMVQNVVVSSEGAFVLVRRIVEGAPHPGRRKKKRV